MVTWNKMNERFQVQFEVEFGRGDATGQVVYMDFVFGPGDDYVRNDRLGLASFVPYILTPAPTETVQVTAPLLPSPTSIAATEISSLAADDPGFPWDWVILPVALLSRAVGWVLGRRRPAG